MAPIIRVITLGMVTIATVLAIVAVVSRAKQARGAVGSVLLALSGIVIGKPPQDHYIEQLKEDKGKKGAESGGPNR